MTDPNASNRTISLNDIGQKYFSAIQRLSDLTVYAWAGSRAASEQGYDEVAKAISGLPSTPFHLSFDAVKEESENWILKHSVNELLGLTLIFLEDVRKLAGLVAFNAAKANASGDLASLAAEINATQQTDFPERLKQLKDRYNITSPVEAEMLSLPGLGRLFFQRNGVVGNGETLELLLKAVQPPAEGSTEARLADYKRVWNSGERITLSRQEHAAIFTTVSVFFSTLLNAVQEYAKSSGLAPEPVA